MAFTIKKRQELIKRFLIRSDDTNTIDAINEIINEYGYLPKTAIAIGNLANENKVKKGLFYALLTARFPGGLPSGAKHYRPRKSFKKSAG